MAKVNGSKIANDLYSIKNDIKIASLALSKTKEAKALEKLSKKQKDLEQEAFDYLVDNKVAALDGGKGKIGITESVVPTIENWDKFYAFIHKNKAYHMLGKKAKTESIRQYWEDNKKKIPGVDKFVVKKLSVQKGKEA